VFGDKTLADSRKRLLIPSYSLDSDDVYIFKTAHHTRLKRDWRVPAWQVALATSAAPTYFPTSQHTDQVRLIDGGVWANNPTVLGIAEAVSMLGIDLKRIRVLSLGTSQPVKERSRKLNHGGLIRYALPATDIILRAQSCGAHGLALHFLGEERVSRINPVVPDKLFDLDKLNHDQLYAKAREESRKFSPRYTQHFAGHHAPMFTPLMPKPEVVA
jgi:predicted acylesterase/phospholipase RssA